MLNMTIGTLELLLKKTNPRTKNPTLLFKRPYINAHHGKLKYAIKILTSIGLKGGQNSYIDVKSFRDKLINDNNSSNDVKKSQKS